jgi:hypothetical protein
MMHATTRVNKMPEGIDTKRFKGIDLLGDAQYGEFGSDRRAHTPGDEETRHQRPHLTKHRARQLCRDDQIYCATIYERCPDQASHNHGDNYSSNENQRYRAPADFMQLDRYLFRVPR